MKMNEISNSQQNIKSSAYFKTNLYTNDNSRIPSFEAGKNFVTLPNSTVMFPKMIMSKPKIIIVPKMTIGTIIKQLLNIFKVHKTGNISGFSTIDSPIGQIKLTKKGIEQYLDVINLYAGGFPQQECYAPDKSKVIKAKLMMEVLGSLGEFSTQYNNVVKSKTFGKIKVTERGVKQYLDAISLYAEGFPQQECYAPDKSKVIKAQQIINVIKGNGEYYEPGDNMVETIFQNIVENTHNSRCLLNGAEPVNC